MQGTLKVYKKHKGFEIIIRSVTCMSDHSVFLSCESSARAGACRDGFVLIAFSNPCERIHPPALRLPIVMSRM